MSKKYSYNYDHDTDTTTITSIEKVGGQFVTTTKTVEGNQTPQETFLPTTVKSKIALVFGALVGLNVLWSIAPAIVVTPVAVFGALKATEKKKTNEKVIAGVGAGVLSVIACSLLFKQPTPTYNTRTYVDSRTEARQKLQEAYGNCRELPNGQFVCPIE